MESARKTIRKFAAAAPDPQRERALSFEGRLLNSSCTWQFDTASPYAALLVRASENAEPPMQFDPLPDRQATVGEWLDLELKSAIDTIKVAAHAKEKGSTIQQRLDRMSVVGLALRGGEAHVCGLDEEPDVLVDPRYLVPGLGFYPATLLWAPTARFVAIVTPVSVYLTGVRGK